MYIHERPGWPRLLWDDSALLGLLAATRHKQGRLCGRMEALGLRLKQEAVLSALTQDVLKSSEIEGERLSTDQVRSSLARRLGVEIGALAQSDRHVDGVVDMILDATLNYERPVTQARLFSWHAALFPTGRSGLRVIGVGAWRDDRTGPMQVVSGPIGRERVHYEAPSSDRLSKEMRYFLKWINASDAVDPVLKAGLAHFWFVTLHPFDDGNGRVARALADLMLARSEQSPHRFYSMSLQIRAERDDYYRILEKSQKGGLDVTEWMRWFLQCLGRAVDGSEKIFASVLRKARFWERHGIKSFNDRQRKMINRLLDGFEGALTSSKWAKIARCSQDTAHRDILELMNMRILSKDAAGGRSTSYSLIDPEDLPSQG